MPSRPRSANPAIRPSAAGVTFTKDEGRTYSGTGRNGRSWRVSPVVTGWRLEFRDPRDEAATYAGTFVTASAAQSHAS